MVFFTGNLTPDAFFTLGISPVHIDFTRYHTLAVSYHVKKNGRHTQVFLALTKRSPVRILAGLCKLVLFLFNYFSYLRTLRTVCTVRTVRTNENFKNIYIYICVVQAGSGPNIR